MLIKERILAYIDILGFENLVLEAELDESHTVEIDVISLLDWFSDFKSMYSKVHNDIEFSMFSDTLVFSAPLDAQYINVLVSLVSNVQKNILQIGYPTRGVIYKGNLYHNSKEDIIYGSALINAYRMERGEVVKFPRVVIDSSLLEEYGYTEAKRQEVGIIEDTDGKYFVDFIYRGNSSFVYTLPIGQEDTPDDYSMHKAYLSQLLSIVKRKLSLYSSKPEYLQKWNWLERFLSNKLQELGTLP